ncbi:hypothetical protein [Kribbella sindirgiensis]|uniref:DUF559 domain-containing protein n=1 Tax=Kribbella sindirgiensis TaxID=1124744 RepID=A0A4R0J5L6_9ACTN|nr:hypothetical protein [Kribbella sindirgiensis]TCC39616.1 hypothetical protein E0H50_06755 [Kribbella sindirgiensis]
MLSRVEGGESRSAVQRYRRAECSRELFDLQYGVASRRQLYAVGVGRWDVRAELRAGRWARRGPQSISNVTGVLCERGRWWSALIEVGSRAALDGVTALQAAGLTGFIEPVVHISMPKSGRPRRWPGVVVHETRRRSPADLVATGIPRVRPAVAAVRAALWAASDRQAALILTMATQQRLVTVATLTEAMTAVRRHRRRKFLLRVLVDLQGGVQSMAELDFARMCRTAALPEPDRQVTHDLGDGWAVVDNEWTEYDLVVEIEGVHHLHGPVTIADALRQNSLTVRRSAVLRIPVLGLRTEPARFLNQVRDALIARGWQPG